MSSSALMRPPAQAAVAGVRRAASTEAAAAEGRLDGALRQLAAALDASAADHSVQSTGRLETLELLVAVIQASLRVLQFLLSPRVHARRNRRRQAAWDCRLTACLHRVDVMSARLSAVTSLDQMAW
jgi:hypothetical protein